MFENNFQFKDSTVLTGMNDERSPVVRDSEQATEADWLTTSRDSRCAEPLKLGRCRPWRSLVTTSGAQRQNVQQATETDWITRECDSRCAESPKTRPPSSVAVTCAGDFRLLLG
jgi:hypothetical protein